jgi:hypothetical protein
MGRLIDAEHALQRFIKETEASGKDCIHINTIKRLLQDIDTAYDVEKVVEEIEEFYEDAEHYGFASALSDIVEVVKWGGVE